MREDLALACAAQGRACRGLGAPFTAALVEALPAAWPSGTRLDRRAQAFTGDLGPSGASVPLRLAGGLHHLHLTGAEPALAPLWPGTAAPGGRPEALGAVLPGVLSRHDQALADWIGQAPQTNETGRSAVLLALGAEVAARTGLPLHLSELGASAGLNLLFDRYALQPGGAGPVTGAADSPLRLMPDWQGGPPRPGPVVVAARRGVDLNPLSPVADGLRLLAYVWPDQPGRLARLRAALALAAPAPPPVDGGDAAAWLAARLAAPRPGRCHLIFSTIAFQYFPPAAQAAITAGIEAAGARVPPSAPLAWAQMEADGKAEGAGLTLRLWPGDLRIAAGRAGFHGQWVDWRL